MCLPAWQRQEIQTGNMSTAIYKIARAAASCAAGLVLALVLAAGARGQSLTIGLKQPIRSVDPHFYNNPANNAFSRHIFESLVATDARFALRPSLAESWRRAAVTTWEFRLRQGVKFHDGSEFTADDVLYSLARAGSVPNSPSGFARYTRRIVAVDKIDAYTVRIKTAGPHSTLLQDLTKLRIMSLKAAEGKTTDEINAGQGAVGTGPYRLGRWQRGKPVTLARYADYWGARPEWEAIIFQPLPDAKARVAALLKGKVQLIDAVPPESLKALRRNRKIALAKSVSNRLVFLEVDSGRNKSPSVTGTRGRNPLRHLEIRRAISLAINRKAITESVMKGAAVPAGQILPKGVSGGLGELKPDKYDPKAARRQLGRGGYRRGFGLTLHGPKGYYPYDVDVLKAVAVGLNRIGIAVKVESKPGRIYFPMVSKRSFSLFLNHWRLQSADVAEPLTALLATFGGRGSRGGWGRQNHGRFSNAELDALLRTASNTMDEARRTRLLREATSVAIRNLGIIPLYFEVNRWAMRKNLRLRTRIDGATLAMNVISTK